MTLGNFRFTSRQLTRGVPVLGVLPSLAKDPMQFLTELAHHAGDVAETRFFMGKPVFVVTGPEAIEQVLVSNHKLFTRLPSPLELVLGQGLLTTEGAVWQRQAILCKDAFALKNLDQYVPTILERTHLFEAHFASHLVGRDFFNLSDELMRLTYEIISRALFSDIPKASDAIVQEAVIELLHFIEWYGFLPFPLPTWLPLPKLLRYKQQLRRVHAVAESLVEDHLKTPEKYNDFLMHLIRAKNRDTGEQLSRQEIRDQVLTFLLVGHETTAIMLSWTLAFLFTHPEVLAKVDAELASFDPSRVTQLKEVFRLEYTMSVIMESMRLRSPTWSINRTAVAATELAGTKIPKGAFIMIPQYVIHRTNKLWPDSLIFDPDRFSKQRRGTLVKNAYLPFGLGPRSCVGEDFSLLEGTLILAMLVKRFRFEIASHPELTGVPLVTYRPKFGVWARVRDRSAATT